MTLMSIGEATRYRGWIDRVDAGDSSALNEMFEHFQNRLLHLSRLMLKQFPKVRRWEGTDDVFLEAMVRMQKALEKVKPETPLDFLRLAALQIRRELLTMADDHRADAGPSNAGYGGVSDGCNGFTEPTSGTDGPCELAMWAEFHEKAGTLEPELSEVFALVWYDGLTQKEAADVLGVSERTVRSRWLEARLAIRDALGGQLPGGW
jgi:RNA polymerase sigma-70 factor (ECF subfamily)